MTSDFIKARRYPRNHEVQEIVLRVRASGREDVTRCSRTREQVAKLRPTRDFARNSLVCEQDDFARAVFFF